MSNTTILRHALAGLALTTFGALSPAFADHDAPIEASNEYFRADHPLRVYVDVDTEQRRRGERDFENTALYSLRQNLPSYVRLVDNPRRADLVINAELNRYDLDYRVVDRDREDKEYGKHTRHTKGQCGQFYRAFYVEVKEVAEARARYTIKTRMRHHGRDIDQIRLTSREDFKYATGLKAQTNCGLIETQHAPNPKVRDLLEQSSPAYREGVARQVRHEAAEDLGQALAAGIRENAERYYAGLARFMSARNDHRYRGHDWFDDNGWDDDWRDDNDRRGQSGHNRYGSNN